MRIEISRLEMRLPGREHPLFFLPSLEIASGSRVLIHGPSGSGKSTLLHLLSGQFPPHAGSIRLDETELARLGASARAKIRRERIGIVFQRANLVEHLDVRENICLGLPALDAPEAEARAALAAREMGLEAVAYRRAGLLSPGEQQRVAVARAWAASPPLLLADEPTSSLDDANAKRVLDALWEASQGKTLVVVSHDPRIRNRFDVVHDFSELTRAPTASEAAASSAEWKAKVKDESAAERAAPSVVNREARGKLQEDRPADRTEDDDRSEDARSPA